jgi:2-haloacid dehalogenase
MPKVLIFDVNETLLDLGPLNPLFQQVFDKPGIMQQWFAILLHSSLVTTLTSSYSDFGSLADAALDLVASQNGLSLAVQARSEILYTIKNLPPHPDVTVGLERLRAAGLRLATLTNSPPAILSAQMKNSGLDGYFERLISVGEAQQFKPANATYRMAAKKLGVEVHEVRLVAAHDWDVFGALRAGCFGAYIARHGKGYHPLYDKPDITGIDLIDVADKILSADT